MATIAAAGGVDQIAAESDQLLVFLGEIQRDRRDFESLAYPCILVVIVIPGTYGLATDHDAHKHSNGSGGSHPFDTLHWRHGGSPAWRYRNRWLWLHFKGDQVVPQVTSSDRIRPSVVFGSGPAL